jgi:hypothetical protein
VRALALGLVAVAACGGSRAAPAPLPQPAPSADIDAGASDAAVDALSTLANLAARAPEAAPGMRELQRGESTRAEILHGAAADTCVRVAFAASQPVAVRLESSMGAPLASVDASLGAVVPPRGPVCVRRGDGVRVSFDGPSAARVRWIAWGAP